MSIFDAIDPDTGLTLWEAQAEYNKFLHEWMMSMPKVESGTLGPTPQYQAHHQTPFKQRGPWVEFDDVECIRETEKASLMFIDSSPEWIPKSHISEDSEVWKTGQKGKLIISEWIAIQKNLVSSSGTKSKPDPAGKLELVEPYKLYRQLARKYHPDINQEGWASEVMKDLTELWHSVLKAGGKR